MSKPFAQQAIEAANYINTISTAPDIAIVLGSGLSIFAQRIHNKITISYSDIPYFRTSTVPGHSGNLVIGTLSNGVRVAALCGRSHLYEGIPISDIVHPTRVMAKWGCSTIIYTNAAGGITAGYTPGDLMLISDHINMTGRNPLVGPIEEGLGERFIDMSHAYDPELQAIIQNTAKKHHISIKRGVYLSLLGPSYETPAEIRAYQRWGADAVGMSTVLEVIAARQCNMRVAGISCITNLAAGIQTTPLNHQEVKETANLAKERFGDLIEHSLHAIQQSD